MDQDERDFIQQSARRVEEWESTPRSFDDPYSDMTTEEKSRLLMLQARMLEDRARENERLLGEISSLKNSIKESAKESEKTLASVNNSLKELVSEMSELRKENKFIKEERDRYRVKMEALAEQLATSNRKTYGSKSLKGTSKKKQEKSREQDKDDFDGTPGSVSSADVAASENEPASETKARTQNQKVADILRTGSSYRCMDADRKIFHSSDLSLLPPGAELVKTIERYAYEQVTRVTEHTYQLVVYRLNGKFHCAYLPAEGEPEIIDKVPGTHASSDLLAHLAFNRFVLDTPLYRELGRLNDEGMRVSRKTLTNWLHKGSLLLAPVVEQLKLIALEKDSIINCDETWCRVKVLDQYRKRYVWCLVNKLAKIVIYCYEDGSRSRDALKFILGDAELKGLQSDGYNVYMYLDKELTEIDHVCCLAHARAKFKYALDAGEGEDCEYILDCIAELYALERTYAEARLSHEEKGKARKLPATLEIIGRLRSKLNALMAPGHPPYGKLMYKAVTYLDTFWKQIFRYIEDGKYSIDNNIAERMIRPLAGERKNSLFFGSHKMARASALYHTVISTCRMMGCSAMDYLKTFFRKIVKGVRDYPQMMPDTIGISLNKC